MEATSSTPKKVVQREKGQNQATLKLVKLMARMKLQGI